MSFGHKYGEAAADIVLDVRCLENPFWVPELRELSGLDQPVRDYILGDADSRQYMEELLNLMTRQADMAQKRGCESLKIAVGCTGGHHRSVTVAILLAEALRAGGHEVLLTHRDVDLTLKAD